MSHISGETDFALERDSKGKIADFRETSLRLFTDLCVSVTPRAINIGFAPLDGSKSLTQRRKDAEISDRIGRRLQKWLVLISEN